MRLNSVLRRVWSTPDAPLRRSRQKPAPSPPPPPPPPPHSPYLQHQERAVIASYRTELDRLATLLQTAWHRFDAEPDEYHLSLELRELRIKLTPALESYYAACGARSNFGINHIVQILHETDHRLARLDHEVIAEVERFEHAAFDISARYAAATSSSSILNARADADDSLIELELYQDGWAKIMDGVTFARLERTHAALRSIATDNRLHTASSPHIPHIPAAGSSGGSSSRRPPREPFQHPFPTSGQSPPTSSGRISTLKAVSSLRSQKRTSRQLSSFDSFRRSRKSRSASQRLPASTFPERDEKQLPGFSSASLQDYDTEYIPDRKSPSTSPSPPQRSAASSADTTDIPSADRSSNDSIEDEDDDDDDSPLQMVMARNRTLRDIAESVMNTPKPVPTIRQSAPRLPTEDRIHHHHHHPPPHPSNTAPPLAPSPPLEQPALVANSGSFASTLYQTRNARANSISDAGVLLRRSAVRGDGRCLFRSLVRGRAAARRKPMPVERVEREAADHLRLRTVSELKKHRELLAKFFVIEGNFGQYLRKMAQTRTYGGEPELLMLAKLLHVPIAVYISKQGRYRQIQVYGKQYHGDPLRILYSDGTHYDALLEVERV